MDSRPEPESYQPWERVVMCEIHQLISCVEGEHSVWHALQLMRGETRGHCSDFQRMALILLCPGRHTHAHAHTSPESKKTQTYCPHTHTVTHTNDTRAPTPTQSQSQTHKQHTHTAHTNGIVFPQSRVPSIRAASVPAACRRGNH